MSNRKPKIHYLKTWPVYYKAIVDHSKTFEVRKNDRDFQVGDCLVLLEFNPASGHTGEMVTATVSYVMQEAPFVPEGFVIMGIKWLADILSADLAARRCMEIAAERCKLLQADAVAQIRLGRSEMARITELKADQFVWMENAIMREFGIKTGGAKK